MNNKKLFVNHRRVEFQPQQKRSCGMRTKKSPKKCGSWMIWIFYSTLWPTRYSLSLLFYGDICCLFLVLVIPFNSFVHFFSNFSLTTSRYIILRLWTEPWAPALVPWRGQDDSLALCELHNTFDSHYLRFGRDRFWRFWIFCVVCARRTNKMWANWVPEVMQSRNYIEFLLFLNFHRRWSLEFLIFLRFSPILFAPFWPSSLSCGDFEWEFNVMRWFGSVLLETDTFSLRSTSSLSTSQAMQVII